MTRRIRELGGDICLAGLQGAPDRIFKLIHGDCIFRVFDTVEEAADSFSDAP